jgi:hypothetical protein
VKKANVFAMLDSFQSALTTLVPIFDVPLLKTPQFVKNTFGTVKDTEFASETPTTMLMMFDVNAQPFMELTIALDLVTQTNQNSFFLFPFD